MLKLMAGSWNQCATAFQVDDPGSPASMPGVTGVVRSGQFMNTLIGIGIAMRSRTAEAEAALFADRHQT